MKRLSLTFALLFMASLVTFAQEFKGSPTKAKAYLTKGDLANAKGEIEAYLNGEKFKKKPKASGYLLQGEIYKAIATSDKSEDQALLEDPIGKALEAFSKVKGMVKEGSSEHTKLYNNQGFDATTFNAKPSIIEEFRLHYFNKAAKLYNDDEDFEGAMAAFEKCYRIQPEDTSSAFNAFSCASLEDDQAGMERSLDKLHELNYPKDGPYITLARSYFAAGSDLTDEEKPEEAKVYYEKMLKTANRGLKAIPSSGDLVKFQIEGSIRLGKSDDAIKLLSDAVQKDPQDSISMFSLAILYEKKEDFETAEKYYLKTLEIEPNYYNANVNLASYYLDRAKAKKRMIDDLVDGTGYNYTDEDKANALIKERKAELANALKYLEKCHSLKPGNEQIEENIEIIKGQLKRD